MCRYEDDRPEWMLDRCIFQASHRKAPVDEVMRLTTQYHQEFYGWNVQHFYSWYRKDGGQRSYSWVKNTLQAKRLVKKGSIKGGHRKRRPRLPLPGMMIHQDGSMHHWIEHRKWDLIVTMDDATNEHYSMFFVEEEGTLSNFSGIAETIEAKGLFCSFYTDQGAHYWHTPKAGGKVDKDNLTQVGRAMQKLGIDMIAAYPPEAIGRSELAFRTHQERLPRGLKKAGITTMREANQYLLNVYIPAFNKEFMVDAYETGSAFIPCLNYNIADVLCEQYERKET